MKEKLIIGNWKENPESSEVGKKLLEITKKYRKILKEKGFEILSAPPNIFMSELIKLDEKIILQDISKFESGSHTGEVSYKMLKSMGVPGSIVGHSERRESRVNIHGDRDEEVNQKLKNLLNNGLLAVLCIGESVRDGNWKEILEKQIKSCLQNIGIGKFNNLIIAYEPIWAIGENALRPATKEEIIETINFIKSVLANVKVLYGGSVDESNIQEILNISVCDGVLVGRSSSDISKWEKLLVKLC